MNRRAVSRVALLVGASIFFWAGVPCGVLAADDREIVGRVVDPEGQGIPDADVGLMIVEDVNHQSQETASFAAVAKTDADGTFRIPWRDEFKKAWGTLWAHAKGFGPARLQGTGSIQGYLRTRADKPHKLQLEPGKSTTLLLHDAQGKPVADALVTVMRVRVRGSIGWLIPTDWADRFRVRSDAQGIATIESFSPETLDHLRVDAPASGRVEFDINYFLNNRPAQTSPHFDIELPDAGKVTGTIQSAAKNVRLWWPITLRTSVPPQAKRVGVWGVADVRADETGAFAVERLAEGALSADLSLPANQPLRPQVPVGQRVASGLETVLIIDLVPAVKVRGLIRKQDTGEGYPNFRLGVIYGQSAKTQNDMKECVEVETDAQGYYTAMVPPGFVELRLHSAPEDYHDVQSWGGRNRGGRWGSRREVPANVEEFELEPIDLVPTEKVSGKLIDKNGKPLAKDWTVFGFPRVVDADGKVQPDEMTMNSFSGVNTDREGRFSGNVPKTYPPVRWRASWREPKQIQVRDVNYEPKVVSQDPLVLQVEEELPKEAQPK
ncbi:MAG TPA: carboxypeptidase-like regulatory domain-containing protein [Pirellulales bacterium]|nr:carboxypeptidase-like regulatory domain-containing protein [Pirellulales bacterium]